MSYQLTIQADAGAEVRRAADEQLRKALDEASDAELSREERVHQVRKRLKKTRAALRLVRPAFAGSFSAENAYFRAAGRLLSDLRDADVRAETIEGLDTKDAWEKSVAAAARRLVAEDRRRVGEDAEERLDEARSRLREGRERVKDWRVLGDGFDALAGGLKKTYGRARKARRTAYAEGEGESFHDWRKRVKYHRYHVRLLRSAWPELFGARHDELKRLSDLLGDAHDLTLLAETLKDFAAELDEERRGALARLMRRNRSALRESAAPLGKRLFVEKPKRYVWRVRRIWAATASGSS